MSTKVIKLQDNENNVLLPVTDAKLVQMKVENATKSVQDVIIENELITARALTDLNDTKQDVIDDLDEIRAGAALGVTALQTETQLSKGTTGSGNAVTDISVNNHQITLTKGATFLTEHQDLSSYADGAEYDSTNHYIYLKHGNTRLSNPINASDFIKDGMVDTVEVTEGNLVITFNTDSGKEDIEIPLSEIFDPSLYYTKEEIDEHELVTARSLTELHDTKQELLTFDSTPTANSTNPVTSEGIKEYVDDAIDASTPMTEITYSDLVTARNNNNLKPGTWYRITDYTTTTTQENTQSAGHQFDIVLLALSENKLAEEGWAMMHENDTYFANSNLSAWKVWYCLDNDTARFTWADDNTPQVYNDDLWFTRDESKDKHGKFAWYNVGDDNEMFTDTLTPKIGDILYSYNVDEIETEDSITAIKGFGRGVIYRLIDEFNNDIKYDFKNIQFKRKLTDGQYDATNGTDAWCYTLNIWYNSMCQDASIVGNTLPNDEGFVNGVYDNKFGYATAYDLMIEGVNTFAFALGNNVVLSFDDDGYFGIHSNTIGNSFYSNTIGNNFYFNTIGNHFTFNVIGNGFYLNTIGNGFFANTIGNAFQTNTIGNNFGYNTIGNGFYLNTIGNAFQTNTIGNEFYSNTIGNEFYSNTIGNQFSSNTIGNQFSSNTIGNEFYSNTIGNEFFSNTIGTKNGNIITTIDYVRYIRVEDGVQYVDITTSATTSVSNYLQNITIAQGVSGTSSTRKVITHGTLNDTFRTTYQSANSQTVSV